jgi:hypothetical protein
MVVEQTQRAHVRRLQWVPLGVMIAATLAAMLGLQGASSASAIDLDVRADVAKEVHLSFAAGSCRGSGGVEGTLDGVTLTVANNDTSLGNCSIVFGSNNSPSGATLNIANANAGANSFFCVRPTSTGACGSGVFNDGSGADLPEGSVGAKLVSATGCSSSNFSSGAFSSVLSAGTNVCATPGTGDATYVLNLSADPTSTQPPGTYRGRALVTATAN